MHITPVNFINYKNVTKSTSLNNKKVNIDFKADERPHEIDWGPFEPTKFDYPDKPSAIGITRHTHEYEDPQGRVAALVRECIEETKEEELQKERRRVKSSK